MSDHDDERADDSARDDHEPAEESAASGDDGGTDVDASAADDDEADEAADADGAADAKVAVATSAPRDDAAKAKVEPVADSPWWSAAPGKPVWQRLGLTKAPLWYRVGQVLLPPLLAAGALGVHWWLNVPDKILESPKDQGAKQPDKKPTKGRMQREKQARRDEDARTPEQYEADWTNLAGGNFDDEPTRSAWARRHQALINRAMVIARREGFEGAPEEPRVVLASTKCRSVRCRFVMRSPYRHELDLMASALQRMQVDGETIWRSFQIVPIEPPKGMPATESYAEVTVGFLHDDTDSRSLELAPAADDADDDDENEVEEELDPDEAGSVARAEQPRRPASSPP